MLPPAPDSEAAWQPATASDQPAATTGQPTSNPWPKRLAIPLIALLLVVCFAAIRTMTAGDGLPKPNSCVTLNAKGGDVEWKKADCGETKTLTFTVAKTGKGAPACPVGDYMEYTLTGKKDANARQYACLIPNLAKDLCYDVDPDIPGPVACDAKEADVKVGDVVEDSSDASACGATSEPFTFSEPARVICVTEPR